MPVEISAAVCLVQIEVATRILPEASSSAACGAVVKIRFVVIFVECCKFHSILQHTTGIHHVQPISGISTVSGHMDGVTFGLGVNPESVVFGGEPLAVIRRLNFDAQLLGSARCQPVHLLKTQPEVGRYVAKPCLVFGPVAIEVHTSVDSLLNDNPV